MAAKGGFGQKYSRLLGDGAVLASIPQLQGDVDLAEEGTLQTFVALVVALYSAKPNILTLHMVTGLHSLLVLQPYYTAASFRQALQVHYLSTAALYLSIKTPDLDLDVGREGEGEGEEPAPDFRYLEDPEYSLNNPSSSSLVDAPGTRRRRKKREVALREWDDLVHYVMGTMKDHDIKFVDTGLYLAARFPELEVETRRAVSNLMRGK